MKGLSRRNTHVKYESPTTYQSKVMTKVKVLEKKVKLQGQRVKVMVSNERFADERTDGTTDRRTDRGGP
jgi:hypothetical protein